MHKGGAEAAHALVKSSNAKSIENARHSSARLESNAKYSISGPCGIMYMIYF